jgi:hypothetical protein
MRMRLLTVFMIGLLGLPLAANAEEENPNQLTKEEKAVGFKLLFNGRDLKGWKQSGNWVIQEGAITRTGQGGSLTYETAKVPDDFELRFQWKVAKGSNSGVYYRPGQYEYQILDNVKHVDGRNPRTSAASLYFCIAPSHDATAKVGAWNTGRIVAKGTVIQHWLNGKKVIDFDYADPRWKEHVELLRLRGGKLDARGASLNLQDHGDPVWYRSIRMRAIPRSEKLASENLRPQKITRRVKAAELKKLRGILARRKAAAAKKKK